MNLATLVIVGLINLPPAGGPGDHPSGATAGLDLLATVEASWGVAPADRPTRDDSRTFLVEDEDEDDTFDDVPLAWGLGPDARPSFTPTGSCAGRRTGYVPSRSASPTLRLRC